MTAVGKIFVIVNLLFSLVVAGFIVVVYARSTNWQAAATKWSDHVKVVEASRTATEAQLQQLQAAKDAEIAKVTDQLKAKDQLIADAKAETEERKKELEQFKIAGNKDGASFQSLSNENEKRKAEVVQLEGQVKAKDDQIVKLIEGKNTANDLRVAAEIKANSFQGKAERLELRLRETEIEIVKLKRSGAPGGGAGGVTLVSTANPPPMNVDGVILETTPRGDLMRISIGSDAGLVKGHTLDVYRLKPTPQYLGQIRLTDVRASEAVGQPVDRLKGPVQKGDLVANDVTPRK